MIALDKISYSYSPRTPPIFTDFSLTINSGDWVIVTGEDGAGKSTLLKLVKGLLVPTGGSIRFAEPLTSTPEMIGYLGGDPYDFIVGITVEEDIAFGMENRCLPPEEMAVHMEHALARTGLTGMEHRVVHTLSGGEQQKVAIAGVLAAAARVLVIDEGMSMLDRPTRKAIRTLLSDLRSELGLTILEASSIVEDTLQSERIIFLAQGKAVFDGPPGAFVRSGAGAAWLSLTRGVTRLHALFGGVGHAG